ncbi:MAG TPA: hypothetical protein VGC67_05775 [Cellulomonas sp.]
MTYDFRAGSTCAQGAAAVEDDLVAAAGPQERYRTAAATSTSPARRTVG